MHLMLKSYAPSISRSGEAIQPELFVKFPPHDSFETADGVQRKSNQVKINVHSFLTSENKYGNHQENNAMQSVPQHFCAKTLSVRILGNKFETMNIPTERNWYIYIAVKRNVNTCSQPNTAPALVIFCVIKIPRTETVSISITIMIHPFL